MSLASEIRGLFPKAVISEGSRLSDYTTFRLGGPCPLLIEGARGEDLPDLVSLLRRHSMPYLVIGQGSNLVISDAGLDCAIIRFCSKTPNIHMDRNRVTVSGNTLLDDLVVFTIEREAGDLSFCSGIPGTVGGGLAGNAGAFGRQIGDHLVSAELLDAYGQTRTVAAKELDFSYRHSRLKETGEIVFTAVFELPPAQAEVMRCERDRIMEFRREHHPDWRQTPCAGSVFRNIEPTSAAARRQAAGWFLEQAGAFGMRSGGARLYEKHANIIVADPGCTAQDVRNLSDRMARAVKQKFGLDLVCEVRFLGKFD